MNSTFAQKSTSFILPYLDISYDGLESKGLVNTYIGCGDEGAKYFYIEVNNPGEMLPVFMTHKRYKEHFDTDNGNVLVKFSYPRGYKTKVLNPFIEGRYSEIDREYVQTYFPTVSDGKGNLDGNRAILDKRDEVRNWWYTKYEIEIEPGREVWSIINKNDETYEG